jgi:hypothetical protein
LEFAYHLYDEYIVSELKIPFIDNIDLNLAKQNNPIYIKLHNRVYNSNKNYKDDLISLEKAILYREKTASFTITKGSRVDIHPFTSDKSRIAYSLLNAPLGYCIYQRGFFVMHGSSVESNNKAAIFLGLSGAGKSTLSTFFCKKNDFNFISEDISKVVFNNDDMFVSQSHPFVKLDKNTSNVFKLKKIASIESDRLERSFYAMSNLKTTNTKIAICYFLSWGETFSIKKLTGISLLSAIKSSTLSAHPFESCMSSSRQFMEQFEKFANNIPVYHVVRNRKMTLNHNQQIIDHWRHNTDLVFN